MSRFERVHEKYQPELELAQRWSEWSVFDTPNLEPMAERFDLRLKIILMNSDGDREWMAAHVLSHLDLGHHLAADEMTESEESDADLLTRIRLDLLFLDEDKLTSEPLRSNDPTEYDELDIPFDGEPTVDLRHRGSRS